ncbi:MAG: hypothetical protein HQM08_16580 [Candidatus Riflebacteria bacterium]|nr:hypothetical protein [Candidatus Riflebacteria bacterium]
MPPNHQFVDWNPGRILNWAQKIGPNVTALVKAILESKAYPEQGFRACMGILSLGKKVGNNRLDAACARAMHYNSPRYKTVFTILQNNQESQPLLGTRPCKPIPKHDNLRGPEYFQPQIEQGDENVITTNH